MNILIVGAGKVGSTLAAYLSQEDHDITIIDNDEDVIQQINDTLDVMCIKGPGAAPSVLREAGAKEADLVLATTNMDEVNMLCASPPSGWAPSTPSPGFGTWPIPRTWPPCKRTWPLTR